MAINHREDDFARAMLRTTAREFLGKRVPIEWVAEQADRPHASLDSQLWDAIASMGWTGITFPESLGGSGLGLGEEAILFEELGRSLYPGPFFASVALAAPCIGSNSAAVRRLIDGSSAFTLAWAEAPGCSSLRDVAATTCRAEWRHGAWVLNGTKIAVPDADAASEAVVFATSEGGASLYLIDLAATGVRVIPGHSIDGTRRSYSIALDNTVAELLAGPDQTPDLLSGMRRRALAAASYEALGVAERVLTDTVQYACTRRQFGKAIGSFQAVAGPLADSYVEIQLARALADWAVLAVEIDDPAADVAAAAAKSSSGEAALRTVERAIQFAGAIGFTWEYHLHRFLRRSAWLESFEGNAFAHRALVASAILEGKAPPKTVELMDDGDAAAYRSSVLAWIEENLPTPDRGLDLIHPRETYDEIRLGWQNSMRETGNLVAHWPVEYGGRGTPDVMTAIFREEAIKAHPRVSHGDCGDDLVAPLLMRYGTEAQKQRFLGPIRMETVVWAQAFSEPEAGSDLASLKTRAVKAGDAWVISGGKTWSTYSPYADWLLVLARTDPETTRHRGISCFLVDATTPGVEIRPIRDIAGSLEFGEIFFTDVKVPDENMLGSLNDGWNVAIATLSHERVIESYEDIGELGFVFDRLLDGFRDPRVDTGGLAKDSRIRDRIAALWCRLQAVRLVQYRCVLALESADTPPTESDIVKLVWSEVAQDVARLGLEHFAMRPVRSQRDETIAEFWEWWYLVSRSLTIYAGTSEIIRSVVAERVLGLPRSR